METDPSALNVMLRAYELGRRVWPDYSNELSRHDFTQPQLFACLVVRELLRLSYRRTEAFLRDVPDWLSRISLCQVPDHNTLWRAFGALINKRRVKRALDLFAEDATTLRRELKLKPLTIDSTCYEPRHHSHHYDRVCRKMHLKTGQKYAKKYGKSPGSWGKAVNASRSRAINAMPKLSLAVAASSHRILAARARLGNGSDAPDFDPLLFDSWRRAPVKVVVADAGYDSEMNHCAARLDMGVRSIMPAKIGRPTTEPPLERFRRLMHYRFKRNADRRNYSQRAQSETVNSMMKRNLGEFLRSIRPQRRVQELMLRPLVHNLMLG